MSTNCLIFIGEDKENHEMPNHAKNRLSRRRGERKENHFFDLNLISRRDHRADDARGENQVFKKNHISRQVEENTKKINIKTDRL